MVSTELSMTHYTQAQIETKGERLVRLATTITINTAAIEARLQSAVSTAQAALLAATSALEAARGTLATAQSGGDEAAISCRRGRPRSRRGRGRRRRGRRQRRAALVRAWALVGALDPGAPAGLRPPAAGHQPPQHHGPQQPPGARRLLDAGHHRHGPPWSGSSRSTATKCPSRSASRLAATRSSCPSRARRSPCSTSTEQPLRGASQRVGSRRLGSSKR
jgi:hypothetical protein